MITVLKPGLLTTVQDLGRPGYQQYGIVVGGALDAFAARVANLILGNDDNAAVLEMAQTGPELRFEQDALVAWCGADFEAHIGNQPLPPERAVRVAAGETITFGFPKSGLRAWLAVAGGIEVPLVLGSRTTYRRAGIGGHQGMSSLHSRPPVGARPRGRCGPVRSDVWRRPEPCGPCADPNGPGSRRRRSICFLPPTGRRRKRPTAWACGCRDRRWRC